MWCSSGTDRLVDRVVQLERGRAQRHVADGLQAAPKPSASVSPLATHSPPITATSEMSTTSSFGPPAVRVAGVIGAAGEDVADARRAGSASRTAPPRSRCSGAASPTAHVIGLFTPLMPVRNVVTRSVRGKLVGAVSGQRERDLQQRRQRRVRHVGRRTGRRPCGREPLNLSLSGRPMTTSLTSGMPRRETCVHAPPTNRGRLLAGLRRRVEQASPGAGWPSSSRRSPGSVARASGSSCALRARGS